MTTITSTLKTKTAAAALALGTLVLSATGAFAVDARVKAACSGDYFSYCSQHAPGSPGVRQCMRANGHKLSKGCVGALIAAGMVGKSETSTRSAAAN